MLSKLMLFVFSKLKNPDETPALTEAALESSNQSQSEHHKSSDSNSDGKRSPKSPRDKSPKSKSPVSKKTAATSSVAPLPTQTGKKGKKTPDIDENSRRRIPLIPRRPLSQDGKDAKKKKAKNADDSSPPPPEDPDERLIYDAYKNAFSFVSTIVNYINNYNFDLIFK